MNGSLIATTFTSGFGCVARNTRRPMRPKPLIPTLTGPAFFTVEFALMMFTNSGFSDAPPTRKPSMSACLPSSSQFFAFTEPP